MNGPGIHMAESAQLLDLVKGPALTYDSTQETEESECRNFFGKTQNRVGPSVVHVTWSITEPLIPSIFITSLKFKVVEKRGVYKDKSEVKTSLIFPRCSRDFISRNYLKNANICRYKDSVGILIAFFSENCIANLWTSLLTSYIQIQLENWNKQMLKMFHTSVSIVNPVL